MSTWDHLDPAMTAQEMADTIAAKHEQFYRCTPMIQLVQTAILERPDGAYEIVVCPWGSAAERALVIESLKLGIAVLKVQRYAFFSEVWRSTATDLNAAYIRASQDPNREEQVFTLVCDRRLPEPVIAVQKIIRGKSGGVRKLLRVEEDSHGVIGALTDLFPRDEVMQ